METKNNYNGTVPEDMSERYKKVRNPLKLWSSILEFFLRKFCRSSGQRMPDCWSRYPANAMGRLQHKHRNPLVIDDRLQGTIC